MQYLSMCTEHTMKSQRNLLTKLLTAFSRCLALAVSAPLTPHGTVLSTGKSLVLTWGAGRTPQVCLVQPETEHSSGGTLSLVNLTQIGRIPK